MLKWFTDLLWPSHCLGCGVVGTFLCPTCSATVAPRRAQSCPHCRRPTMVGTPCQRCQPLTHISRLIGATDLRNPIIEQAVWRLKYRNGQELAGPLGALFVRLVSTMPNMQMLFANEPLIVPVPLHPSRLRSRGYNQAELLARPLAQAAAVQLTPQALVRSRATQSQVGTHSRTERRDNMVGAFSCPLPELVAARHIILVDDVSTTGATLGDCARALAEAGAASVSAITLAHG